VPGGLLHVFGLGAVFSAVTMSVARIGRAKQPRSSPNTIVRGKDDRIVRLWRKMKYPAICFSTASPGLTGSLFVPSLYLQPSTMFNVINRVIT